MPESNNENYLEDDSDKYLLMGFGTDSKKQSIIDCEEEEEEEGVVDLEGELIMFLMS